MPKRMTTKALFLHPNSKFRIAIMLRGLVLVSVGSLSFEIKSEFLVSDYSWHKTFTEKMIE